MNDKLLLLQILKTHYVNHLFLNQPEVKTLREARLIDYEVAMSSENLIFRISLKFKYIEACFLVEFELHVEFSVLKKKIAYVIKS